MTHIRTPFRRTAALALAGAFLLGAGALAAESAGTQARREDLTFLYETLETRHPDLFANTPETEFLARKAEIEGKLETISDIAFSLELQGLVALVGDSHTSTAMGNISQNAHYYPMGLARFGDRWYLSTIEEGQADWLGAEVTAINGLTMDQVVERFGRLLSADNPVKLQRQYRQACNVEELYVHVGIAETGAPLSLTLRDSQGTTGTLELQAVDMQALDSFQGARLAQKRTASPATAAAKPNYLSMALNDGTYYIQYNRCAQDPEMPMETFAAQVRSDLDAGSYRRILVDLRNNGGGSDGVIWPLLLTLRDAMRQGAEVVGLIGETTFSSAIINAVELQEMGAVLVGEPASGSVDHFGSVDVFTLPNSGIKVQHSTKYIDLGTLLDADAGRGVVALTPDVEVPQTLTDYLAGKDSAVEYLLAHPERLTQAPWPDAPLTRGRIIGTLYKTAGAPPQAAAESPFSDSLEGIEWFAPALVWGQAQGIVRGTGDGRFSAAQAVTWQETAVFLSRTVKALDLEPATVRTSPLPSALADGAWELEPLQAAWSWGLLPENADFTQPPTRAQGQAMVSALGALH